MNFPKTPPQSVSQRIIYAFKLLWLIFQAPFSRLPKARLKQFMNANNVEIQRQIVEYAGGCREKLGTDYHYLAHEFSTPHNQVDFTQTTPPTPLLVGKKLPLLPDQDFPIRIVELDKLYLTQLIELVALGKTPLEDFEDSEGFLSYLNMEELGKVDQGQFVACDSAHQRAWDLLRLYYWPQVFNLPLTVEGKDSRGNYKLVSNRPKTSERP